MEKAQAKCGRRRRDLESFYWRDSARTRRATRAPSWPRASSSSSPSIRSATATTRPASVRRRSACGTSATSCMQDATARRRVWIVTCGASSRTVGTTIRREASCASSATLSQGSWSSGSPTTTRARSSSAKQHCALTRGRTRRSSRLGAPGAASAAAPTACGASRTSALLDRARRPAPLYMCAPSCRRTASPLCVQRRGALPI
mmetsp:Transcript_16797/g.44057  ORF Transcript_16797/g.44057 Transcript_16797/m.44057 type:complete len:203 (-) Transcript_16797:54-662(-)